jgi:hypothetical protein
MNQRFGKSAIGDEYQSRLVKRPQEVESSTLGGIWTMRCIRPDGTLRWETGWNNIVVNEGKQRALNQLFNGLAGISNWYIGLMVTNASWAQGQHAWTLNDIVNGPYEFTAYTPNTNRPQWTPLSSATMNGNIAQVTNTSTVDFTISTNGSVIGGAFLSSVQAVGGTAGELYAYGRWVGDQDKNADQDDVLQVTATMTATSP